MTITIPQLATPSDTPTGHLRNALMVLGALKHELKLLPHVTPLLLSIQGHIGVALNQLERR